MGAARGGVKRELCETAWLCRGLSLCLYAMTSPIEQKILRTLIELDEAVKGMATAQPKPNLLPLFARLDELAEQLPRTTDPELLHFLQRKSYEKVRAKLEGRAGARGSCGR